MEKILTGTSIILIVIGIALIAVAFTLSFRGTIVQLETLVLCALGLFALATGGIVAAFVSSEPSSKQ